LKSVLGAFLHSAAVSCPKFGQETAAAPVWSPDFSGIRENNKNARIAGFRLQFWAGTRKKDIFGQGARTERKAQVRNFATGANHQSTPLPHPPSYGILMNRRSPAPLTRSHFHRTTCGKMTFDLI